MMRFAAFAILISSVSVARADAPSPDVYRGWLKMYDLSFDQAHQIFAGWKQSHPADPLGPVSDAAAVLFAELARLGVLESELFTHDDTFKDRRKLRPDPQVRVSFDREIKQADQLADAALQSNASDKNALFAKCLIFGLRADFASLVEKQDLTALKYTKQGRPFADKLLSIDPKAYDAYLGSGVENYLLSLKPAPLRVLLRITGAQVDRQKGIEQLRMTAEQGHYLEPFAKLLLAVAALRDNNPASARALLSELHNRFPNNPLYVRELSRLIPGSE
jgi:hypothetical protein